VQQWYIQRYSISGGGGGGGGGEANIRDQLNTFLYLILNLCGCFDMNRLEQDLPLLFQSRNKMKPSTFAQNLQNAETNGETNDFELKENLAATNQDLDLNAKRAKCFYEGTDDDWEYLINDDLITKFVDNESNLREFTYLKLNKENKHNKNQSDEATAATSNETPTRHHYDPKVEPNLANKPTMIITTTPKSSSIETINENIKTSGLQFTRQKRPIVSTTASMFDTNASC
jgi:hypothetical protein